MKELIIITFSLMLFGTLHAQVTFNKKYDFSTSVVKLETLGYKYYLMDVPNEQCKIYNLNHSLFKTINCSVPNGFYLTDVKFVSENLFDNDSEIEILCTYYKYISTATSYYYEYDSKIINENRYHYFNHRWSQI